MSNTTDLHFPAISALNENMPRTVIARELHQFLEVESRFDIWIKRRIEDYGFIEKQDFIANDQKRSLGFGRGETNYYITLDMAKELAMVERNHKGRLARRHFIEAEKAAQQSMADLASLQSQVTQLQLLIPIDEVDQKIVQLKELSNEKGMGLSNADIGRVVSLKRGAIRTRIRRLEQLGRLTPPENLTKLQQQATHLIEQKHVH